MKTIELHPGDTVEAQSVYRGTMDEWLPALVVGPAVSMAKRRRKLFRVLLFHPSGLIAKALRTAAEMRPRQAKWNRPPIAQMLDPLRKAS